ncbi:MAG: NIPSNAP family protein [Candidatus Sumerlaeia bacterium]|nr:NIPSNAP family protein [Candidatus Sumerlaeia bacterium]
MKRRVFFGASAAALAATPAFRAEGAAMEKQLLELRICLFKNTEKMKAWEAFMAKTAIPAMNRNGVSPVGAFKLLLEDNPTVKDEIETLKLYVLIPHNSAESLITLPARMAKDATFRAEGKALLEPPKDDPAFVRYESSLMLAFDYCPKVEVPTRAETRVLQLRIYESHSRERAMKKIQMFNEGGEIDIFRRTGMNPVFFGQTLIGTRQPNLTYMLGFENKDAMDKAWATFRKDEAWLKLSKDPEYRDTVSNITNLILRPIAGSQI